jgi:ABC-type dipeptide/oligopeptide/nickel transport system ATPase component
MHSNNLLKDFEKTFGGSFENLNNKKQILENFAEFLNETIVSINNKTHNIKMVDRLCETVNNFYKKDDADIFSVKESDEEEESEETKEGSDVESKEQTKKEESVPKKDNLSFLDSSDDDEKSKTHFTPPTFKDAFYESFINNTQDINKRILKVDTILVNNYCKSVYTY